MSRWFTPEAIETFVEQIAGDGAPYEATGTVLDEVANGLGVAAEAIRLVEALVSPDPLSAIGGAAVQEFQDAVLSLLGTDVYVLPISPKTWGDLLRPYTIDNVLDDLASSVTDTRDPNRPVLPATAAHASLTILVGANNWEDFTNLIKIIGELFNGTELNRWSRLADIRFNFDHHVRLPPRDRNSQGVPWDWWRTNWMEAIPPVTEALEKAFAVADSITGFGRGMNVAVSDLVDTLKARAVFVRSVVQEIAKVVDLIRRWKELFPRLKVLATSSHLTNDGFLEYGGTDGYVQAVTNAGNRPEFKLSAGITFAVFGETPDSVRAQIAAVGRVIGLKAEEVRSVEAQLGALGEQ